MNYSENYDSLCNEKNKQIWIFGEKFSIVHFYDIKHNSQYDCWIGLKFYEESPDIFF
jgi:hypothetical protein